MLLDLIGSPLVPSEAIVRGDAKGGGAMIVRFIKKHDYFDPEATAAMSEAFDAACKELHDAGQPEVVLEVIAGRIIEAAKAGEFDPSASVKRHSLESNVPPTSTTESVG